MNKDDINKYVAFLMNTLLFMVMSYAAVAGLSWTVLSIFLRNTELESILTSTLLDYVSQADSICAIISLCFGLIYIAYVEGKRHAEKKQQKIEAEWKSE